eukprot:TRINITY_DN5433_c0_g1_i1.p1 TRINITY_DN5433_c0_g1~~TRINITY_DN5433_c0_g1_i1.p1  ORF type:complete len:292 (-),score=29.50 TRINITY_DN5433_c0_g1_i1:139-969(-)
MGSSALSAVARGLEGKVALITGGASGIGECPARLFAQHGAKVVIADIQDDLGHSVYKDIGSTYASYVHCDVTNEDHIRNAVDTAITKYGKLDIMFNNAGVLGPIKPSILENEKADFERVVKVNVMGAFLGTKHAARVMIPARSGCIITTASVSSVIAGIGTHGYTCSKHALLGLMKNTANELGQFGIRVNCVSPYLVATPFPRSFFNMEDEEIEKIMSGYANLKGVILKKEDVARAALYLGSADGRYVSGHNLVIDGGFSIVNPSLGMFKSPEEYC